MGLIAPKARKHLSADALFGLLRNGFAKVPDYRNEGTKITMTDALMSGFAMFSLKCPAILILACALDLRLRIGTNFA